MLPFGFCPNNIPQRSSKSTFGANETQMSLSISDATCLQIFLVSFRVSDFFKASLKDDPVKQKRLTVNLYEF